MPFFVAVYQELDPGLVDRMISRVRWDFAMSKIKYPGRRSTRVFQRLGQPNHLTMIGEWDAQADYEVLRQSAHYQELTVNADPPARIEYLTRLRSFERVSTQPSFVWCVRFTVALERVGALEDFLLHEVRQSVEQSDGLLSREVFRVGEGTGQMLVIHSWRTSDHFERYRALDAGRYSMRLAELEATTERFSGAIAGHYSRLDATAESQA